MSRPRRFVDTALAFAAAAIVATGSSAQQRQQTVTKTLRIAAASDLQAALPELASRFQRDRGIAAIVSFGSSGNFFAQIANGAPFDVFFSADIDYPRQLVRAGHADGDSLYEYATGRIVVWARRESGIDVRRGLDVLRDSGVRRIAIANPQHAPYGRAAVEALRRAKLHEVVQPKLVLGENVSQAAQLVDSGNADAGIIALSLALGPALRKTGSYAEVPDTLHDPIRQAAVVVSRSQVKEAARIFMEYLRQPETGGLLHQFGFTPPK
jgi:molybdate transport system substrate-binding protein